MGLLQLPPETLLQIFSCLDTPFFREDVRRLSICKQWYLFAYPIFLRSVVLSTISLRKLVATRDGATRRSLAATVETLQLKMKSCENAAAGFGRQQQRQQQQQHLDVLGWKMVLEQDVSALAAVLRDASRLHSLRIEALHYPQHSRMLLNQVPMPAIRSLISAKPLRVLALDLPVGASHRHTCHICPIIAGLLQTLEVLHVRLHHVCPEILQLRQPDAVLRLKEVVVNTSLLENIPGITCATMARPCPANMGLVQLLDDMRTQAEELVQHMAAPRKLRLVKHVFPLLQMRSLDILTGNTMKLREDEPWSSDGEVIKVAMPPESDESSDSDGDSFFAQD